jgi:hypothetical protein
MYSQANPLCVINMQRKLWEVLRGLDTGVGDGSFVTVFRRDGGPDVAMAWETGTLQQFYRSS